jgi:diaminopimelate epimerase
MHTTVEVTLMSGAGNLFSVVDNRRIQWSVEQAKHLAPALCKQVFERQTEGLMLIGNGEAEQDFQMEFFNPDGSHGAMCGNGGRCAVWFAHSNGIFAKPVGSHVQFSALDTLYHATVLDKERVRLVFPPPREVNFPLHLALKAPRHSDEHHSDKGLADVSLTIGYVNVGSDHAVVWFDELGRQIQRTIANVDIQHWGALVRHHSAFARGANANFYALLGAHDGLPTLHIRTFERGVEAETGACGTGAIATALVAYLRHDLKPPVRLVPPSGSPLVVNFLPTPDNVECITLEGSAEILDTRTVLFSQDFTTLELMP